jgi:hypothetical protein
MTHAQALLIAARLAGSGNAQGARLLVRQYILPGRIVPAIECVRPPKGPNIDPRTR